jgi:putative NIF3 family GTP cyclohydrolase 1 type 2
MKEKVVRALIDSHPYEEVAYDLYPLENSNIREGLGCTGTLNEPVKTADFPALLAKIFSAKGVRYSSCEGEMIWKVAVCGGAGSTLLNDAISCKADAFVTSDVKYHSFLDASGRIFLADIGHYESEIAAKEILYDIIIKKFPKFALRFSEVNTNPINYL